jgi:hypothetical protein
MLWLMATPPIVALIDDLLAARKALGGLPTWRNMNHHGQHRLVVPILFKGESTGLELEVCAYPNREPLRFTIILRQPKCIWRVEYDPTASHPNPFNAPKDIAGLLIVGPHYHNWSDNRRFITSGTLPKSLKNARLLPLELKTFEAAFDWFCRETNIEVPPPGTIALPARTELF